MPRKRPSGPSSELNAKEISALIEAASVTEEEIQQWHSDFLQHYPSGRLDKKAFCEYYGKLCPNASARAMFEGMFDSMDTDDDGTIDFNELLVVIVLMSRMNALESRLAFVFDLFDYSGDGFIDRNELADVVKTLYDRAGVTDRSGDRDPKKRAQAILEKIDSTEDNKLNKAEFIKVCKEDPVIHNVLAPNA